MRALSRTCSPENPAETGAVLWLWPGQALYAGPSLGLDTHSGSVACLATGVDGPFAVTIADHPPVTARSALIPPRLRHKLVAQGERMVFCYLDPTSVHAKSCLAAMTRTDAGIRHTHRRQDRLISLAASLGDQADLASGASWLRHAAPATIAEPDERILAATRVLLSAPQPEPSAAELAAKVGLSASRFLHLFKQQSGTSFRRYRLWARMLRAAALYTEGHDLTTISAEAGFATPSHLSSAFRDMFGLTPTRFIEANLTIYYSDHVEAVR